MKNYPSRSDLRDVLTNQLSSSRTRAFFKERGILLFSNRRDYLAEEGSRLFLGYGDLVELKQLLIDERNYRKSGRLYIFDRDKADAILVALQDRVKEIAPNARVQVAWDDSSRCSLRVTYTRRRPGMNDLLEEERRHVNCVVEFQPSRVAIHVAHQDRSEFKVVEDLIEGTARLLSAEGEVIRVSKISLRNLSLAERIDLFDRFFRSNFGDWRLTEVLKVALKADVPDEEDLPLDEGEVEGESNEGASQLRELEATPGQLKGLTTAVLEGTGLRENPFVQECLENGFYFSACQVRLRHIREPKVLDLEINFRSHFSEVNVRRTGYIEDDKIDWNPFPHREQDDLLWWLQDLLYRLYRSIIEERTIETT